MRDVVFLRRKWGVFILACSGSLVVFGVGEEREIVFLAA